MSTSNAGSTAAEAVFIATVALFLGALTRSLQVSVPVLFRCWPYTVQLLIWGLALGVGAQTFVAPWRFVSPGILAWKDISPSFLTALFFPPILFAGSFGLPRAILLKASSHIALLGILGVATGAGMTAVAARYVLPYNWTWSQSFLFGAIVAATDPVAAIVLLKEVNAPEEIRVTVDGEALVDDGVAAVLFAVFRQYAGGEPQSPAEVVKLLCRQSLGGPAIGLAFALSSMLWLRCLPADANLAVAILLTAAFASFFIADEILLASGILSVVTLGMTMTTLGRKSIKAEVAEQLETFWDTVECLANTLVFVVSGILIAGKVYDMHQPASPWAISSSAYGYAVAVWLLLLVIRVLNVALFWPAMARTGHGVSMPSAAVTAWSGLRGVVGLALALYVQLDESIQGPAYREQAFFFMSTTLVLTVVVQGTLYKPFLRVVGLDMPRADQVPPNEVPPVREPPPATDQLPAIVQLEMMASPQQPGCFPPQNEPQHIQKLSPGATLQSQLTQVPL